MTSLVLYKSKLIIHKHHFDTGRFKQELRSMAETPARPETSSLPGSSQLSSVVAILASNAESSSTSSTTTASTIAALQPTSILSSRPSTSMSVTLSTPLNVEVSCFIIGGFEQFILCFIVLCFLWNCVDLAGPATFFQNFKFPLLRRIVVFVLV